MKGYSKIPWIIMGISAILIMGSEGHNIFLGLLALVFFIGGGIPAAIQCKKIERDEKIDKINKDLYKLGYTYEEVDNRQYELQIKSIRELKELHREVKIKQEELKKKVFFEPIDRQHWNISENHEYNK